MQSLDAVPTLSVADVRRALVTFRHSRVPLSGLMRQAAVAAILRDAPAGAELLFIRRAEHPRDPWSGHMAFPGGRVDRSDTDTLAAARRETREEIDLDLDRHATLLGPLSHVPAMAHGKPMPLVIAPFVFELHEPAPAFALSDEVQEVLWVPVAFFREPKNRTTMEWRKVGLGMTLPCYHFEGRVIWGLTLKMVDELMSLLAA